MKKQPEGSTFWLFVIILVCYVGQEAMKFINYFWRTYDRGFLAKAADPGVELIAEFYVCAENEMRFIVRSVINSVVF